MPNKIIEQTIVRAVGLAYNEWAAEHPSLAAVIDRIALTHSAVDSLRNSSEYAAAVAAYHQSRNELELLNQLTELAGPIVRSVLGM